MNQKFGNLYARLLSPLLKAIQELLAKVTKLENKSGE
tara:strand:+ start:61 stop:171 length:111 start_codon:yes stop_codon:yes gene_type:complete